MLDVGESMYAAHDVPTPNSLNSLHSLRSLHMAAADEFAAVPEKLNGLVHA